MNTIKNNILNIFYLLTFFGIIFYLTFVYFEWENHLNTYKDQNKTIVKVLSNSTNSFFSLNEVLINIVAKKLASNQNYNNKAKAEEILKEFTEEHDIYCGYNLAIPSKSDMISSNSSIKQLFTNEISKEILKEDLQLDKMFVGRTLFCKHSNKWVLLLTKSIKNNKNKVAAIVTIAINIDKANKNLTKNILLGSYHEATLYREKDRYLQIGINKESETYLKLRYTQQVPLKTINEIYKTMEEKYSQSLDELKENETVVSIDVYNPYLKKEFLLVTQYNKNYGLWVTSRMTYQKIYSSFLPKLILISLLFFIILFLLYFLFKTLLNHHKEMLEKEAIINQQSKMATMGEMLENIAHQWKQPLSIISITSANTITDLEFENYSKESILKAEKNIMNQITFMSQTIDDFRDFFKQNQKNQKFLVKDTIRKALFLVSSKIKNRNITVIQNIQDVEVIGSYNELTQVIINIINNAIYEIEKTNDKEKLVLIEVKPVEGNCKIVIKDNAGGIPDKIVKHVFDSHFTTKEKDDGTGIGLFMSKQIIEDHFHGTITAYNDNLEHADKIYKGAVFEIIIPPLTK